MWGFSSRQDAERAAAAVRQQERDGRKAKGKPRRYPVFSCDPRNEIWQITILGQPTGGSFDMSVNVLGTTDTLTFDFDFTAAEVKTELATHTNITSTDVDVTGGAFPGTTVNIEFIGDLANHTIPPPTISASSLTGGTGTGVILGRYQPGYPKDGSVSA